MKIYLSLIFLLFFTTSVKSQGFTAIIEYGKKAKKQVFSKTDSIRMKENPSKHQRFQKMREMIADGEKKLTFELKVDKSIGFLYVML